MYGREVDGTATTFGTTGYTFNNIFVLYDRQTETVWYPLQNGAFDAISGPRKGSRLSFLDKPPIVTLSQWCQEHPDTVVLLGDRGREETSTDQVWRLPTP